MQKRFGIDIDGTVTSQETLLPHINKAFQLQLTRDDITEYELTPFLNISADEFYKWFVANEPAIYAQSPLAEGAKQILDSWVNQFKLYFISARNDLLLDVTTQWFNEQQLKYDHIELVGSHYKIDAVKKHKLDLFMEDKHDNAVDIAEECQIPVILFDAPYNRRPIPDNVIRVNTWNEADHWIKNWLQQQSTHTVY